VDQRLRDEIRRTFQQLTEGRSAEDLAEELADAGRDARQSSRQSLNGGNRSREPSSRRNRESDSKQIAARFDRMVMEAAEQSLRRSGTPGESGESGVSSMANSLVDSFAKRIDSIVRRQIDSPGTRFRLPGRRGGINLTSRRGWPDFNAARGGPRISMESFPI
jgi:hypothetical protein